MTRAPAGRLSLRWPAGSEANVKVQGGQLVVSGGGCDERLQLGVNASTK